MRLINKYPILRYDNTIIKYKDKTFYTEEELKIFFKCNK